MSESRRSLMLRSSLQSVAKLADIPVTRMTLGQVVDFGSGMAVDKAMIK